jgi:hypothetical protein
LTPSVPPTTDHALVTFRHTEGKRSSSVVRLLEDSRYLTYHCDPRQPIAAVVEGTILLEVECNREEGEDRVRVKHWPCVRMVENVELPGGDRKVRFEEDEATARREGISASKAETQIPDDDERRHGS